MDFLSIKNIAEKDSFSKLKMVLFAELCWFTIVHF